MPTAFQQVEAIPAASGALAPLASGNAPPYLLGGANGQDISKNTFSLGKGAISIDWLAGSVPVEKVEELTDHFEVIFDMKAEKRSSGFYSYDRHSVIEPYGVRIIYDSSVERSNHLHAGRAMLQLPSTALRQIDAFELHHELKTLKHHFWLLCSRIDTAFDDFQYLEHPIGVYGHALAGNFKGFKTFNAQHQYANGVLTGAATNFGKRGENGAGRYLRCYDKRLESGGKINSVRWETEFSADHAKMVFNGLADSETNEHVSSIGRFVGGSIDFVDRSGGGRADRCKRLDFWQQILDCIGSARVAPTREDSTIESIMEWVETSVTGSLGVLRRALGDDQFYTWLNESIDKKYLRLSDSKRKLANDWRVSNPELASKSSTFQEAF